MLQRVYGTAFFDKKELDAQLAQLEEAKKRDHRRLGRELNLFTISQLVGPGLILWMPKGAIVRGILESFIKEELVKRGYQPVYTPHIGKIELYQTSGHYPYYKDSQFPTLKMPAHPAAKELLDGLIRRQLDDDAQRVLLAKAGHSRAHARARRLAEARSRRLTKSFFEMSRSGADRLRRADLRHRRIPAQADELPAPHPDLCGAAAKLSRAAAAAGGVRHGLSLRAVGRAVGADPGARLHPGRRSSLLHSRAGARRVSLDDGDDPVLPEFVPGAFRLSRAALARAIPNDPKYQGAAGDIWRRAEDDIRSVLIEMNLPYEEAPGEAAFYGPKADFIVRDCIGRQWQLGTVQLDYVLPERFGLEYIGPDNQPHRPVMIHRAPLGSMERFMGILIEHFAGAFPLWLAPEQVRVLPISDKVADYARQVLGRLLEQGFRATRRPAGREDRGQDPRRPAREDPGHARRRRQGSREPGGLVTATGSTATWARCRWTRPWTACVPSARAAKAAKPLRRRPAPPSDEAAEDHTY